MLPASAVRKVSGSESVPVNTRYPENVIIVSSGIGSPMMPKTRQQIDGDVPVLRDPVRGLVLPWGGKGFRFDAETQRRREKLRKFSSASLRLCVIGMPL